MTAVWSATDKNANVTVSGAGLVVTSALGTFCAGRGDTTLTVLTAGQKIYLEHTITALTGGANNAGTGFCNISETFADNAYLGEQAAGFGFYEDGSIYVNNGGGGTPIATGLTFVQGDVICWAINVNNLVWVRRNGGLWLSGAIGSQNPATDTGGVAIAGFGNIFPAYCVKNGGKITANFGATAFAFTPPAGFTGIDSVPAVVAPPSGGGFRHIGRHTRDELEAEEEVVTVTTTEDLPVKPPSRKMRKRLAIAAKANPVEDEEEEAFMMLLAA